MGPTCTGTGKAAGACAACAGTGRIGCAECTGTGLRPVTKLAWGPVAEFVRAELPKGAEGVAVWQGVRRGCIVTAIRANDLFEGALTEHLRVALGGRREFLALCIDNRDGRDQVRFSPGRLGLRLVTEDARQIGAAPPAGVEALIAKPVPEQSAKRVDMKPALERLLPAAILPGAAADVLGAFPAGTDFARVGSVYRGDNEPLRLERRRLTADELAAVRKSLR